MKRMMLLGILGVCQLFSFAQTFNGTVVEKQTRIPVAYATVSDGTETVITDTAGHFSIPISRNGQTLLQVSAVGLRTVELKVSAAQKETLLIEMERISLFLQPIEVKSTRAADNAPFSKNNLSKKEIEKLNIGQDIPFVLNQTPSVVVNADAGNGIGYTGIRIRGTDATRINMTLNGIPYNDAESQGLYFVDLPDIMSSTNSIQIQRGAGTSSNGAGAFGATLNLSTNEFNEEPYGELNNSFGSFNSWKHTMKVGSGLIDGKFTVDGRLSRITSDGFIDRARTELRSFYLSMAYLREKTSIRLNIFSGKEKSYQAWNGIPEAKLRNDKNALLEHYYNNLGLLYFTQADSINLFDANPRSYNVFTYRNQTDNYQQDHYQFFINHAFSDHLSLNVAAFLTKGNGYYEEYKYNQSFSKYGLPNLTLGNTTLTKTDLIRQLWLNNSFYGGVFSFQYKKNKTQFIIGGAGTEYDGGHYGNIIWARYGIENEYQWYNLTAYKKDFNLYAKLQRSLNDKWDVFADLQWRNVNYHINGFRKNPGVTVDRLFNFINPKAGISYHYNGWNGYFSYSLANKEPNRDDFEANVHEQPKAESLHDFEMGVEKKDKHYAAGATLYYMFYKDQLILTGKINDVGAYTRTNIPNSYRAGIELQGKIRIRRWLHASGNISFSENKIKNFNEYIDDYDNGGQKNNFYKKTDIALSPSVVAGSNITFIPVVNGEINIISKYVSKQYLDNTGNEKRKLDAFFVNDLRFAYKISRKVFREINIFFQLNNVFNVKYEPNGYTYSYIYGGNTITENFYFPMAGTNIMTGINIKL
jgi:iron complex outermembrane receptor protein